MNTGNWGKGRNKTQEESGVWGGAGVRNKKVVINGGWVWFMEDVIPFLWDESSLIMKLLPSCLMSCSSLLSSAYTETYPILSQHHDPFRLLHSPTYSWPCLSESGGSFSYLQGIKKKFYSAALNMMWLSEWWTLFRVVCILSTSLYFKIKAFKVCLSQWVEIQCPKCSDNWTENDSNISVGINYCTSKNMKVCSKTEKWFFFHKWVRKSWQ